jgi:Protein of unknown function (DUF1761)
MCPFTHANYLVLGAAVVSSFIFGYLWYGPLFGKTWAQLMGIKMGEFKPKPWALPLTLLGTVLTTFVLSFILYIYKPYCPYGAAFFIWLGFYLPRLLGCVTWEGQPWKLFALNAAYYFLNLQLITAVLTIWS